jgi:hypothetical protein
MFVFRTPPSLSLSVNKMVDVIVISLAAEFGQKLLWRPLFRM